MKMTPEDFAVLKAAIESLDIPEGRQQYRDGNFPRAERVKDLDMRYRWDLFTEACVVRTRFANSLYAYLDDDHIDTALRKIVQPL